MLPTSYRTAFDQEELAFQSEVADFLRGCGAPARQYFGGRGGPVRLLYEGLGSRGWLSLCWPKGWGGSERALSYEFLLWDTLAYYRAARPDIGPGMIARTIIANGTDAQRRKYLPLLGAGALSCALGYSESEAGSDLTHLRTRAVLDGEFYRVTGRKLWTSDAHHAKKLWLLCRTGQSGSGRDGLTILFVDLDLSGVEIRPIPTIDGHQINEVLLDDVKVPAAETIGEEGNAWRLIREALATERHIQVLPGRLRRDVEQLRLAISSHRQVSPDASNQLDRLEAQVRVVEAASLTTVHELSSGGDALVSAARAKLLGAELAQTIPRVGLELLGPGGVTEDHEMGFLWRQSIMETIAGGSVEIALSLIAREGLGLRVQS